MPIWIPESCSDSRVSTGRLNSAVHESVFNSVEGATPRPPPPRARANQLLELEVSIITFDHEKNA